MKVLIAYDGSECAEATVTDLPRLGLPAHTEALVLSVAELWLPPSPPAPMALLTETVRAYSSLGFQSGKAQTALIADAKATAQQAVERIQASLPSWTVRAEGRWGLAAAQILKEAEDWRPNLIIVGSHNRSTLGRILLGSTSQKILTHATCSVRIARPRAGALAEPIRLVVATDGLPDAETAVRAVARRQWPAGTEAHLVTAYGPFYFGTDREAEIDRMREVQAAAADELRGAGLSVVTIIEEGDPTRLILEEAEKWQADSIFLGTSNLGFLDRILLGSVSNAVVTQAICSVEVVRSRQAAPSGWW